MTVRFEVGQRVRVRELPVAGHVRTPRYVRGKRGMVERICGAFQNPEELAGGRRNGLAVPLYRVRFAASELWPHDRWRVSDSVDVELYEHWLEAQ